MDFSLVAYDGPKVSPDSSVRKTIRQQAMRETAAKRKQKGGYGKNNLRQYPVFVSERRQIDNTSLSQNSDPITKVAAGLSCDDGNPELVDQKSSNNKNNNDVPTSHQWADTLTTLVPTSARERAIADRFSILFHLTPITGLRLGILHSELSSKGSLIGNTLHTSNQGSRKLLLHIPSRYGHVPSLSYATDCVVAMLRQLVCPSGGSSTNAEVGVLLCYARALGALKIALNHKTESTTAETLCAIELLGIFELLSGKSRTSWMTHTSAATRMIEIRGADNFQTDFEISLFSAHIGPIVMDCFLTNKSCFLEEEKWKRLMVSAIIVDESLNQQQDLVLALWGHLVRGPRAFKEVTETLLSTTPSTTDTIEDQITQILEDRNDLVGWGNTSKDRHGFLYVETGADNIATGIQWPDSRGDMRYFQSILPQLMLSGTYLLCRMLKTRLLVALAPSRFQSLEMECQYLANAVVEQGKAFVKNGNERVVDQVLTSQVVWIAKGIVDTKSIWGEARVVEQGTIEGWKFRAWCDALHIATDTMK